MRSRACAVLVVLLLPGLALGQGTAIEGVVQAGRQPVRDAVVYLEDDEAAIPAVMSVDTATVDQHGLRFVPQVVVGRPGLTVSFLNSDPILHNVFSPGWLGKPFDLGTYPSDSVRSHRFAAEGPHVILCHVHPEMVAYVLIVATPYHAVTDAEGHFRIPGVTSGTYRLAVWRRGSEPRRERLVVPDRRALTLKLDISRPGKELLQTAGAD